MSGVARVRSQALSAEVLAGLRLTSAGLGIDLALPEDEPQEDASTGDVAPGRVLAIYSLSPQVSARAKVRLEQRHPTLTVMHREDKVATEGLLNMVRTADLLVVAIGSAKHAATDAIDANRPSGLPTLRHAFRGSTRIVEAVEDAIAEGVLT